MPDVEALTRARGATRRLLPGDALARWLFIGSFAVVGGLGLAASTAAQPPDQAASRPQVEEEDLAEPELEVAVETALPGLDLGELPDLFARAKALASSADGGTALPLFGQLIEVLEARIGSAPADETARDLLAQTLEQRARLSTEYGDLDAAASDLGRLVEIQPERETLSGDLPESQIELFKTLRRQRIGGLTVDAEPSDLDIYVDGRPRQRQEAKIQVLAGSHTIEARQPGYAPQVTEVEIRADRQTSIEFKLIRQSAVVLVQTRPAEAEVWLDGALRDTTRLPTATNEALSATQADQIFSEPLVVDGVELGLRLLEIRKPGYRPYRAELTIGELLDYPMPPVVLEPEKGTMVFVNLPRDAVLTVNGESRRVEDRASPRPRLTLPPGSYDVRIQSGTTRMFATELRLADRQTVEINVQLRPGLALLGVLGEDPRRAADLLQSLELALATSGRWALLDQSDAATEILGPLGLDRQALEAAARGVPGVGIDWQRAQKTIGNSMPGMLYLLAVLRDDPISSEADLWLWSAPPGPSQPDRRRLQLGQLKDLDELRKALDASPILYRPWLGALVIDSAASPHPVVVDVSVESPAAAAGLAPGDQIAAFAQVPIFARADLDTRLTAVEAGEVVELGIISAQGPRTVSLKLGTSPVVLSDDGGQLRSVLFTELLLREEAAAGDQRWLTQLNRAHLLWRSDQWEGAARLLQGIRAPRVTQGLGQAAVDYWTGLALLALGPKFEGPAAAAFERAAAVRDARLFHNDGPRLAPRARARLLALRAGGQ